MWPQGGRVWVLNRAVLLSGAGGKAAAPREEATPGGRGAASGTLHITGG